MDAYAGEVTGMHPFYAYDSPARAKDMDLATTNAYAGPNHITAGIQHGSWSMPVESGQAPQPNMINSNQQEVREDLPYSNEDIAHVEEWVKVRSLPPSQPSLQHTKPKLTPPPPNSATSKRPGTRSARARWRRKKATASSSTACWTSA